jgi:hypothetical protein
MVGNLDNVSTVAIVNDSHLLWTVSENGVSAHIRLLWTIVWSASVLRA